MFIPSSTYPYNLTVGDVITAQVANSQNIYLYLYKAGAQLLDPNQAVVIKNDIL